MSPSAKNKGKVCTLYKTNMFQRCLKMSPLLSLPNVDHSYYIGGHILILCNVDNVYYTINKIRHLFVGPWPFFSLPKQDLWNPVIWYYCEKLHKNLPTVYYRHAGPAKQLMPVLFCCLLLELCKSSMNVCANEYLDNIVFHSDILYNLVKIISKWLFFLVIVNHFIVVRCWSGAYPSNKMPYLKSNIPQ